MSEYFEQPDLDPHVEYALLHDEARDAFQQACLDGVADTMMGSRGRTLIFVAGASEGRVVAITDYSEAGSEPCRTLQVFGGIDEEIQRDVTTQLPLVAANYEAETEDREAYDADVFDSFRQLLGSTVFSTECTQLLRTRLEGSIGHPTVDMGQPEEPSIEQPTTTELKLGRMRTLRAWVGKIIRRAM